TDLAAGWSGQKLAKRHKIRIGLFVEPFALHDEFVVKIAEMRYRTAEARETEAKENKKHFPGGAVLIDAEAAFEASVFINHLFDCLSDICGFGLARFDKIEGVGGPLIS